VDGNPLQIAGKKFERGLGTHADSLLYIELNGGSTRFNAQVGVDDEVNRAGSVEFRILADGKPLFKSGMIKSGDAPKAVDVDVTGVSLLILAVDSGDDMNYDHADWADAFFTVSGAAPKTVDAPKEEAVILTPKPSPKPRINSPRAFGRAAGLARAYTISASCQEHSVVLRSDLPRGSALNARQPDHRKLANRGELKSRGSRRTTWARPARSCAWSSATRSP
jgi:alpha-galactosidase